MNISSLNLAGAGPGIPIEDLATAPGLSERAKVAEASRQFEAALLRQILTEARKPVFMSTFTPNSAVNGIYDGMVTAQLADSISQSGEFGLARSLQAQFDRPGKTAPEDPDADSQKFPHPSS